jgi:hypothetical protein
MALFFSAELRFFGVFEKPVATGIAMITYGKA